MNIRIKHPWWQTWWAYLSYFLIGLGFLYSVRKFELKRQKKNAAIKESSLRAEAAELHARVIQAENDRKTKELEEARQLQLSMLPKEIPKLPHLDIAVYMKTATEVGGDYYDFSISEDGTLNVGVGDATGHGMQAGTIVTLLKGLFTSEVSKKELLTFLRDTSNAIKGIELGRLMMAFSLLKIKENHIQFSSAGMPPMYIFRKESNIVEEINLKGMPLGAIRNFEYKLYETELNHGDCILLLSDGYPELSNDNDEQIGYERIKKQLLEISNRRSTEIVDYLKNWGSDWVNDKDPDDDVTFVVIKVK
jgi:serine phosphatase RsbU (regulator of sigma subunit)